MMRAFKKIMLHLKNTFFIYFFFTEKRNQKVIFLYVMEVKKDVLHKQSMLVLEILEEKKLLIFQK